ncbi:MAG: superfamily II DNA or RNA helicase, partial [Glaciecola sp.]
AVKREAPRVSRAAIERQLASDMRFVNDGGGLHARWSLDAAADSLDASARAGSGPRMHRAELAPPVSIERPLDGLDLRTWQIDAFVAWAGADCRGVVEAVTGTGKTRLAIAAVRACLARGGRALVIAPTLDLVEQWTKELRRLVPGASIGRLGAGQADDLYEHHIVVATPHSAAAVPVDVPPGCVGLLVADEAHRYGAPTWAVALRDAFTMRLALTATYERNDDGVEDVLGPYFGSVVFSYGFAEAARDDVIAPFRVAFVGTDLDPIEREAYDAHDKRAKELFRAVRGSGGFPHDPRKAIAAAAALIARADGGGSANRQQVILAKQWLSALRARREVAANAAGKVDLVRQLGPVLAGRRTLVFTDTVAQAELAARQLSMWGLRAEEVHGDLPKDKRKIRLAQFANGNLDAVAAPRVLDEGVDVPDADVAIVLAAFRTRRQMIQRLGRVLRRKDDGREAILVIAYAKGTREDPAQGAHEDFLDEVITVAQVVETLDIDNDPEAVLAFVSRDSP